jgi:hypothetical protein
MNIHVLESMRLIGGMFIPRLLSLCKVGIASAVFAFGLAPVGAQATTIPQPVISIATLDAMLAPLVAVPVFTWSTTIGRPLAFGVTISRSDVSPTDVYVGILIPGGRVFSWIPGPANAPVLVEGWSPAGRGITAAAISGASLLGSDPQHLFAWGHPLGLYSVFAVLVRSGADPNDPAQWYGATMSPLVISN